MQHIQHRQRVFSMRNSLRANKWYWLANSVLIGTAFVFVAAVTLGLFP